MEALLSTDKCLMLKVKSQKHKTWTNIKKSIVISLKKDAYTIMCLLFIFFDYTNLIIVETFFKKLLAAVKSVKNKS